VLRGSSRFLLACLVLLGSDIATRCASAQVVMLPTYRTFSVGGSVLVPDRGMAHLGGISSMREGRISRGVPGLGQLPMIGRLFGNRAIGREVGNAGVHVAAEIIDLNELDQQVLAQAAALDPDITARDLQVARKAAYLNRNIARAAPPAASQPAVRAAPTYLEQLRRQNEVVDQQQQLEGMQLWMQAQQMELEGKPGIARIYYQQAARRLTGDQRSRIIQRLRQLEAERAVPAPRP
jgi:type II secretory pathway component GspD/PulD (secretin)